MIGRGWKAKTGMERERGGIRKKGKGIDASARVVGAVSCERRVDGCEEGAG
jgi:hypothetical protein